MVNFAPDSHRLANDICMDGCVNNKVAMNNSYSYTKYIPVNNLKHIQFIISAVDSKAEEKACISLVNNLKIKFRFCLYSTLSFFYLQIFVLYKIAHFRFPREDTIIVQTARV